MLNQSIEASKGKPKKSYAQLVKEGTRSRADDDEDEDMNESFEEEDDNQEEIPSNSDTESEEDDMKKASQKTSIMVQQLENNLFNIIVSEAEKKCLAHPPHRVNIIP